MNEPEHSYEHELWRALADACNVPPGHFKTAGEFIDHVHKITKENEQLKQVNADFDKVVAEVAAFKANDGSVEELVRLRSENQQLRDAIFDKAITRVLSKVLVRTVQSDKQKLRPDKIRSKNLSRKESKENQTGQY